MATVKIFFDTETTGLDPNRCAMHQLSGMVEVDGEIDLCFNFNIKPFEGCVISPEALKVSGVTEEEITAYASEEYAYQSLVQIISKYVDRYNPDDKAWLVGYNNRSFDDNFLRAMFLRQGDIYFGSWFFFDSIDVMVLASQYLIPSRKKMVNFKLATVAKQLGIAVDESKTHNALYDVEFTRSIYRTVTGIECEF